MSFLELAVLALEKHLLEDRGEALFLDRLSWIRNYPLCTQICSGLTSLKWLAIPSFMKSKTWLTCSTQEMWNMVSPFVESK